MLGRDTEWRQGSLLAGEDAYALGLVASLASDKCVIVISHDCDLPSQAEDFVEVIVGTVVPKPNPMLASARNPRRLHLKFLSETGEQTCVELCHADRQQVRKEDLAKLQSSDTRLALPADEKRALKQWLAARYGRPAFTTHSRTGSGKRSKRRPWSNASQRFWNQHPATWWECSLNLARRGFQSCRTGSRNFSPSRWPTTRLKAGKLRERQSNWLRKTSARSSKKPMVPQMQQRRSLFRPGTP